ncbi:MAG TPA: 2-C-methyl-D-erythritol 4-phosphate cytidylyltransferase [Tepidisphaeraceae bacterium]|nr:2-C-methyl-D-erythritol 4-phosphate cytidylyltransferase [Tepidisphaeraceae bacterium]
MDELAVILPAAGTSARFGADRDKLLELLEGQSVIARSVHAFLQRRDVIQVIIPTRRPDLLAPELPRDPRLNFCLGGACRAESVRSGLLRVQESVEWIAVHDAARPLVSQELIDSVLTAARTYDAAVVPALPVTLTVKQAAGPLPARVQRTVPRSELWAMQTPQVMRRADLHEAFQKCPLPLEQITDDVQLLELIGKPVWLVPGEERNLKITTPLDLELAGRLLRDPHAIMTRSSGNLTNLAAKESEA